MPTERPKDATPERPETAPPETTPPVWSGREPEPRPRLQASPPTVPVMALKVLIIDSYGQRRVRHAGREPEASAPAPVEEGVLPASDAVIARQLALRLVWKLTTTDLVVLPVPSKIVVRMHELSTTPAAQASEIESLLQANVTMAAAVIRAAKSAQLSRAQEPTKNLRDAIIRLGNNRALHNETMVAQRANYEAQGQKLGSILHRLWVAHHLTATIGHCTGGARVLARWRMPVLFLGLAAHHGEPDTFPANFPTLAGLPLIARVARHLANTQMPHDKLSIVHPLLPGHRENLGGHSDETLARIVQTSRAEVKRITGGDLPT
ncbi:MAG: HDOD domain-containing protein [Myxococcales bacterium]|nr:HDOD domain-containing protein [Myxococcales bacterium]